MTETPTTQRIAQLEAALNGRTDADGNPKKGYAKNVAALRVEIARLTATLPKA